VEVRGLQGMVKVDLGDWIIAEPSGDGAYPCKPDIFRAKYEEVPGFYEKAKVIDRALEKDKSKTKDEEKADGK
jgi:hypothetical protein